ncbi:MAG: hypothetical protein KC618_04485, partial [Candidatus Omnitrophica bacterium]|nr:hypothetical protein [Candidatus Omnitrophota bacterium]
IIDEVSGTKNQVRVKLNRLIELRIIVKNGTFFYFKDKLFKYWIKYVYQKRLNDIELSPDRQRKEFRDEFNSCVENFKIMTRKGFSSRIVELLHCFDNESLRLNGRKYKLPIFRVIEPVRVRNEGGKSYEFLKASTGDEIWFIVMKKDSFVESDVTAVLAEVKNIEEKPERCVIISLANLDEGTRVRALQERFWIWNERELNTLLTLFDKPFILK